MTRLRGPARGFGCEPWTRTDVAPTMSGWSGGGRMVRRGVGRWESVRLLVFGPLSGLMRRYWRHCHGKDLVVRDWWTWKARWLLHVLP